MMEKKDFESAQFGDLFLTSGGREAIFLGLSYHEIELADFYVKDYGRISVNRKNGFCSEAWPEMHIVASITQRNNQTAVLFSHHHELERISIGEIGELWSMAGRADAKDFIKVIGADGKTEHWCDCIEFISGE